MVFFFFCGQSFAESIQELVFVYYFLLKFTTGVGIILWAWHILFSSSFLTIAMEVEVSSVVVETYFVNEEACNFILASPFCGFLGVRRNCGVLSF